jgi:hypothetical protein
MKKSLTTALVLAATAAHAQSVRTANYSYAYDVDSATTTYCKVEQPVLAL